MTITRRKQWIGAGAAVVASALPLTSLGSPAQASAHTVQAQGAHTAAVQAKAGKGPTYTQYYKYFKGKKYQIPGLADGWVPQGLTNIGNDRLVISYYDGAAKSFGARRNSRIVVVQRSTGKEITYFQLNTQRHVGGLAYARGYMWVATGGHLSRYSTSKLSGARGSKIIADNRTAVEGSASYSFGSGRYVWVGTSHQYSGDWMYRYDVTSGRPAYSGQKVWSPPRAQGVVVTKSTTVWSTSWGNSPSKLIAFPTGYNYISSNARKRTVTAPPRAEGMTLVKGRLQLIFESGSSVYSDTPYKVRSINDGTFIPLKG